MTVQLIEGAASERFNQCAGTVLKATLKATESKQRKMSDIRSGTDHCYMFVGGLAHVQ